MSKIRNPFRERMKARMFDACILEASDNRSEMYIAKLSSGPIYGPAMPRRGAGHRCAFWDGYFGIQSLYSGTRGGRDTLGFAAYRAGQAFRAARN